MRTSPSVQLIPSDISRWDPAQLADAIRDLASKAELLRALATPERVSAAIICAADLLIDSADTWPALPGSLPEDAPAAYSRPMIREALRNFRATLRKPDLMKLAMTTQSARRSGTIVLPPSTIFHVLAGNLFLSGLEAINSALLCGAASLVRCASADRYFPALWRSAIAAADRELGELIAITWWPTERSDLTAAAAAVADCTQAFGSDESVAAVRQLTPLSKRFIAHPSKISFAVIMADALTRAPEAVARSLAYDFSVYDQQGCLSPRAAFIEEPDSAATMDLFRDSFLTEMRRLFRTFPPGKLSLEDRASLAKERNEMLIAQSLADASAASDRGAGVSPAMQRQSDAVDAQSQARRLRHDGTHDCAARLWSAVHEPFVVSLQPINGYQPGCLNRFADLRIFETFPALEAAIAPWKGSVASIGFAGTDTDAILPMARRFRVNRLCRIGAMQKPPLGWSHDGRLPIEDMLERIGVELR